MTDASAPILVPLDGSKHAEVALPTALVLARAFGVPLRILHVIDPEAIEQPVELDHARELFRDFVTGLLREQGKDIAVNTTVVGGPPARTILDFAAAARMVVLASHGRGGFRASVIGSVADKVVRGATVPTLVVPLEGPAVGSGPIVVGLDGSEVAEEGLTLARELADALKLKMAIVRAYSVPPPAGIEFVAYPIDLTTSLKEAAEDYVAAMASPDEESYTMLASPVDALAEVAKKVGAGLVVLTSHGKGFAQRIALGSTTDRAMHALHRPLLVVPATPKRARSHPEPKEATPQGS